MHVILTAFCVLDRLHIGVVACDTNGERRHWSALVQDNVATGVLDPDDQTDMLWLACQTVLEELARRSGNPWGAPSQR